MDVNTMQQTFTPLRNTGVVAKYEDYKEDKDSKREVRRVALLFREEVESDIVLGRLVLEEET